MIRATMAEVDVVRGLKHVNDRISTICSKVCRGTRPRLVAVSKTKPKEMILTAYQNGQRNFGENYIQELYDKGNDSELLEKCKDIKWHFIGHVQSNKVNRLVGIPGLYIVETVDSQKLANALNSAWEKADKQEKLNVMVQVNTSGESEKNGCNPTEVNNMVKHVTDKCSHLKLMGLMTIGQFGYDMSNGPNPDFLLLKNCRDTVCKELNFKEDEVELSMGMSDDFEHAIELGSTNVRVGSSIFGYRERKPLKTDITSLSQKVTEVTIT